MRNLFIFLFIFPFLVFSEGISLEVKSVKIIYGEKDSVSGIFIVKNDSSTEFKGILKAYIESEIDKKSEEVTKIILVKPKEKFDIKIEFKNPGKYGHALTGELYSEDKKLISKNGDYFNVCDNYWNVSLIAPLGCIWQQWEKIDDGIMIPRKDFKWVDDILNNWRKEYYNGFEKFFWAPDDFIDLTPEKEMWFSGQTRYMETKKGLIELIRKAHENGMKAITYAKCTGGGSVGVEIARRNPEWVWNNNGVLSIGRAVKQIAEYDIPTKKHWQEWVAVDWNMNDKNVVKIGINELIESTKIFGWDGARWDGNFDVRREIYDLNGNLIEKLTPEQVDARNMENMRMTKEMISKFFPDFVYGYNWANSGSGLKPDRETIELCRNGGLIMNEYINQAHGVQHPLHKWTDFVQLLIDDTQKVKKWGGYYGPICGSLRGTVDETYKNIFIYASGAHPYYYHEFGDFVTRYSSFIWDNNLRKIQYPDTIINAPDKIWWKYWVYERDISDKEKQIIFHIVNPPSKQNVGEIGKNLPIPIENISINIFPVLNIKDYEIKRIVKLNPKLVSKEDIKFSFVEGVYKFEIPKLDLWNIIVVELSKKGGKK